MCQRGVKREWDGGNKVEMSVSVAAAHGVERQIESGGEGGMEPGEREVNRLGFLSLLYILRRIMSRDGPVSGLPCNSWGGPLKRSKS
jgi:hypothetical protein